MISTAIAPSGFDNASRGRDDDLYELLTVEDVAALLKVSKSWVAFRRTYSSWSHDKGVPGKVVAQLMGHANVDTTLNVYTQVLDGSLRAAVDKVGSELFTIVHKPEGATTPLG
jgi:hypothetical protein